MNTFAAAALLVLAVNGDLKRQTLRKPVPVGVWGGKGVQLTVTATGATISYDCDGGTLDGRLAADGSGTFIARGTHTFGGGGPRRLGAASRKTHKASYQGVLDGGVMRLTVSLPDLGRKFGEFTLELGRRAELERCG